MSEQNDKGEGTAWFEHVADGDYNKTPAPVS
jgi:L,D-peptidoglycan transpeptidase YkuD (ErfK/YbiS/YcfS/YnhG family)